MVGSSLSEEVSPFVSTNEALPRQSKERGEPGTQSQNTPLTNLIESNWSSLPVPLESARSIQPRQKSKSPTTKSPWKVQQRDPEDYEKDRVGKYAEYFKGNEILPIPEIVQKTEPQILSLVVTDI